VVARCPYGVRKKIAGVLPQTHGDAQLESRIVKPEMIWGWFRWLAAQKYDSSKSKVGRPRRRKDIRKLVIEMVLENLGWAT
jgi:hypothetical protein